MKGIIKKKWALGFTLIELLIVVAIIAILAAIAVPNFLEAQVRAKVARTMADARSIRVGIESYYVDNNIYPENDTGFEPLNQSWTNIEQGSGLHRITTPVSFLTAIPKSPWEEQNIGHNVAFVPHAVALNNFLYIRAALRDKTLISLPTGIGRFDDFEADRYTYMTTIPRPGNPVQSAIEASGEWMMKSVGPDNVDDVSVPAIGRPFAQVYDTTNGTRSSGDIIIFNDSTGVAQPR